LGRSRIGNRSRASFRLPHVGEITSTSFDGKLTSG